MEKLIQYLNQFEEEKAKYWNQYCNWQYIWGRPICTTSFDMNKIVQFSDLLIISKMYEFIKRLIDKDKIDFYNILKENWTFRKEFYAIENKKEYERLIMLLSVEDNPLEFLISVLK